MSIAAWRETKPRPRRRKRRHSPRPFAERFAASLAVKTLENRLLLSASTELTLDAGGNLVITDVAGDVSQNLTIRAVGDQFIISDPTEMNTVGVGSGDIEDHATQINNYTVAVEASAVGDQIIAQLLGGNDQFTVDFSVNNFGKAISVQAGDGDDQLFLIDNSERLFSAISHGLDSAGSGTIDVADNSPIDYTGVEEVSDELVATDRTYQFSGGAETITLLAGTTLANRLESTLGHAVEFASPADDLTISAGSGDLLRVNAAPDVAGTTTLNAPSIELNTDINGTLTGTTATTIHIGTSGQIQDGISLSANGGNITVAAGTYTGELVVDKSLTLEGAQAGVDPTAGPRGAETVIDGSISVVTAGSVVIDGFEIHGSIVDPGADLVIENNVIVAAGVGVDISNANSAIVRDNVITAGGDGIRGEDVATFVTIQGNAITLTGTGDDNGIFLNRMGGDVLVGGLLPSDGNAIGGELQYGVFASDLGGLVTVRHNEITDATEIGIQVANFDGDAAIQDNTIECAIVSDSLMQGIYVTNYEYDSLASATIQRNTVDVATGGIWVESVQGTVQVGGPTAGDGNDITAGEGRGILLSAYAVMGEAIVEFNMIVAGGAGIEFVDGASSFTARGNTIDASFESGILVSGSTAEVIIGGPDVDEDGPGSDVDEDKNIITVTNAVAGITVVQVTAAVTIEGNDVTSSADTSFGVQVEEVESLEMLGNEITTALAGTYSVGLYVDNVATDATIQANTLDGDGFQGMQITNVQGLSTVNENTIDGLALGIDLGDSPSVVMQNNVVTTTIRGIYAYNIDSLLEFADNAVTSGPEGTGVVFDGQAGATVVAIGTGNTIDGGDYGLVMIGADLVLDGDTLSDLAFTDQAVAHIVLQETALAGLEIDGTVASYDLIVGQDALLAEAFVIEDKILHAIDDGTLGFIRIQAGNVYVTPDSFIEPATTEADIQRGINVAVDDDTVFVAAGSYNVNVTLLIDRPLTLSGPNAGISAVTGHSEPESEVFGTITVATPGDVIIDGFTVYDAIENDVASSLLNGGPDLVVQNNILQTTDPSVDISLVSSAQILNNLIGSETKGIYGMDVEGDVTIQGNSISAAERGIDLDQVAGAVLIGGAADEEANTIVGDVNGIVATGLASTFTAQGNTITGSADFAVVVTVFDDEVELIDNTIAWQTYNPPDDFAKTKGVHLSNHTHLDSAAGATLQGNSIDVDELAVWIESVQGDQLLEGNSLSTIAGTGVQIDSHDVGGAVTLLDNQIDAGGTGVALLDGLGDFNAQGNFIVAAFETGAMDFEAGILIDGTAGSVVIGGPDEADGNEIEVFDGFAGIEVLNVELDLVIQNNVVATQSLLLPDDPVDATAIFASGIAGETTIQRNFLAGSELYGLDLRDAVGTVTIGGLMSGGSVSVDAHNELIITAELDYFVPGINADVSTILLMANQDGMDSEGFTQDTDAIIETVNPTDQAITILVGGTGDAAISILRAEDGDETVENVITVDVGGAIIDNRDDDDPTDFANVVADRAVLFAQTGIGSDDDIDTSVSHLTAVMGMTGTLTTRTDDETGVVTLKDGHSLESGDLVDVYWDGGRRVNVPVTVSGNEVSLEMGGLVDVLPAAGTPVFVTRQVPTLDADFGFNLNIDEANDITLGYILAPTGRVTVNAIDGLIAIEDGRYLESFTGRVSNAPPILILGEANPDDVVLPGDPTQEVSGYIGGDALMDILDQNQEFGINFTIGVTWDDGITNTLNLLEVGEEIGLQAGDTLIWIIDADGESYITLDRTPNSPTTPEGAAEGGISIFIQRVYTLDHLQSVAGTEIFATFVIHNDGEVIDPNTNEYSLDYHILLTDAMSDERSLNETAPLVIATALAEEGFGQVADVIDQLPPLAIAEYRVAAQIESFSVPTPSSNLYESSSIAGEEATEDLAILFLVRVAADGTETQRVMLPLSDLRDLNGLLERLRKVPMPSGLYRIYHQEPGLPPRKVLEFRKAGNTIGDPIREPGRGANPTEDQAPGTPQNKPAGEADKPAETKEDESQPGQPSGAALLPAQRAVELALREATAESFTRAARERRRMCI